MEATALVAQRRVSAGADYSWRGDILRDVTQDEVTAARRVFVLLDWLQGRTAYQDTIELRVEVMTAHEEMQNAYVGQSSNLEAAIAHFHRAFKSWLSAFVSFDHRTHAWLSRTARATGDQKTAVRTIFSDEYDSNFGYRLAVQLRHVSEHSRNVVRVRYLSGGLGTEIDLAEIADGPHGSRLNAKVRDEMRGARQPVRVDLLVNAVELSCSRIQARIAEVFIDEIETCVGLVMPMVNEVEAAGGEFGVFIRHQELSTQNLSMPMIPSIQAKHWLQERERIQGVAAMPVETWDITRFH